MPYFAVYIYVQNSFSTDSAPPHLDHVTGISSKIPISTKYIFRDIDNRTAGIEMVRSLKGVICTAAAAVLLLATGVAPFSVALELRDGAARPTRSRGRTAFVAPPIMATTASDAPVIDKPKVEKPKKNKAVEEKKGKERLGNEDWAVRLFNDPFNKREFVARCLTEIAGLGDGAAYQVMMVAHQNGVGVIGQYHHEMAEMYCVQLKESGLTCDMIPVDDDK